MIRLRMSRPYLVRSQQILALAARLFHLQQLVANHHFPFRVLSCRGDKRRFAPLDLPRRFPQRELVWPVCDTVHHGPHVGSLANPYRRQQPRVQVPIEGVVGAIQFAPIAGTTRSSRITVIGITGYRLTSVSAFLSLGREYQGRSLKTKLSAKAIASGKIFR